MPNELDEECVGCAMQASAADLCKAAMICVHRRAAAELPSGSCRLLVQIHDELLFEVDEGLVVQVGAGHSLGRQPQLCRPQPWRSTT